MLGKRSKVRCRAPLFPFIPMEQVVIDTLHLFLRISDVLINLLIRDLRIKDGITKSTDVPSDGYTNLYEKFLNDVCKTRKLDKESNDIKYRDLIGTQKVRLHENIDIPVLFPSLDKKEQLGRLWYDFFSLINTINKKEFDNIEELCINIKLWVKLFVSTYQRKDVTPYTHAFMMHVLEFIALHGNLVLFSQQGLEKLNNFSTKQFQLASNHRNIESLLQMLEKRNRIENLEDNGHQRIKQVQTCKKTGHNKRSCKES